MKELAGHPIPSRRAWRSADFTGASDWVSAWTEAEARDLVALAAQLPASGADWLGFDLLRRVGPALAARLAGVSDELTAGKGFALLRGLPADDEELLRRTFWIVGVLLGQPVMQNARGEVLSEVFDRFAGAERNVDTRGYESSDELRFHCDGGDCIGMSCVRQAPSGALNGLVSLLAIYNEILATEPRHIGALERGYPLYARMERGDPESTADLGKVTARRIPVFAWRDGRMSAWLNIQLAELAAQVSGNAMSEAERAALECVERMAERRDMQLCFRQQPGDMLWVNNLAVMHRRGRYEDPADPARRRLLYRMWINLHEAQPMVGGHAVLRGGIRGPAPVVVGP